LTATTTTEQTTEQPEAAHADTRVCPPWCNRAHQAGANPRQQQHENVWRAGRRALRIKVSTYPCPAPARFAGSFVTVTAQSGDVQTFLTVSELRSLAARLTEIADAAQHGER